MVCRTAPVLDGLVKSEKVTARIKDWSRTFGKRRARFVQGRPSQTLAP